MAPKIISLLKGNKRKHNQGPIMKALTAAERAARVFRPREDTLGPELAKGTLSAIEKRNKALREAAK